MINTKLIKLLQSLEEGEFKRLYPFLKSPYHNSNRHIIELFAYLRECHPHWDSRRLAKEKVFHKLFPGQEFDLNKLRKLMTMLTQLVEEYILTLELEHETTLKKKLLVSAYNRRNLFPFFDKNARELVSDLEDAPHRNRAYHYECAHLNELLFNHPDTDIKKEGQALLTQAMEHLDSYYFLSKLQIVAEMRARENILAEKYSIPLLEEVIQESGQRFGSGNLLYQLYINIINFHQADVDSPAFSDTLTLFRKLLPGIDQREQQTILNHLANYCIRMINQGDSNYRKALFELYLLRIETNLLIEKNQITEITFSNIVATGASLKAFDWTRDFIEEYAPFLKEKIREDIKALSYGLWHFNKKEYDQVEQKLLGHNFSDMLNLLKSRCLLIRTYYEQFLLNDNYYLFLIDQCNAFEKFILRHTRISKGKSEAYLNFIRFTKKLAQKVINQEDTSVLIKPLQNQTLITYKEWLLEKMSQ